MLKKITRKRFLLFCLVVLILSYLIQLSLRQSCAIDGCLYIGKVEPFDSLFGLPIVTLQILFAIAIVLWIAKHIRMK